jgi:hypothetical protein
MTTNTNGQFTKLLSEYTAEQKKQLLLELVRDLVKSDPERTVFGVMDASETVYGYVVPAAKPGEMPADENSLEFYLELRRRDEEEEDVLIIAE